MTSEQMQKQNQEQVKALGKNYERSAIEVITPHDAPDHIACLGIAVHDGPHGELEKMCTCLSPFVFTAVVVTPDAVITDGLKKRFDSVVRVDSKNTVFFPTVSSLAPCSSTLSFTFPVFSFVSIPL